MIDLTHAHVIGKGSERICYQHPNFPDRCIKVRYHQKRRIDESVREYRYARRYLAHKDAPVAKPIEWVETNQGRGLVCELVLEQDGSVAHNLLTLMDSDIALDMDKIRDAAIRFRDKMLAIPVSVTDLRLQNICLRSNTQGEYELILIDGIGFANFIKIGMLFPSYTYKQTLKRINRAFQHILAS